MNGFIDIKGARLHNLKNVDIRIPRNKLTVITGVSGSGKSSLAFDTLYEEGKRRYLLFSGAQFMVDSVQHFESITGLSPTVAVEQRIIRQSNPRSTVGTRTKIGNMMAALYATYGTRGPEYDDGLPMSMDMFQKNSPKGMCVKCLGSGMIYKLEEDKLFGDTSKSINDLVYGVARRGRTRIMMDRFCAFHGISATQPLSSLTEQQRQYIKYGDGGKTIFPGFVPWIFQICNGRSGRLKYLLTRDSYMSRITCPKCIGTGLGETATYTLLAGKTITELEEMHIKDLLDFLYKINEDLTAANLINEIIVKLECMIDVGLHHLALSRPVPTLSGGEIQRLFLAAYIIAEMDSIIFIFDEPTIGLHEVEKIKLIQIMKNLVLRGNTVVAVEHDENFMRAADYIVDLGPHAGEFGGNRIFQGSLAEFLNCTGSLTAPYLSGQRAIKIKSVYKPVNSDRLLKLTGADIHNLRNVSAEIPLGLLVGVAGVSGSGKSSLVADTLVPKLQELLKSKFIHDNETDDGDSKHKDSKHKDNMYNDEEDCDCDHIEENSCQTEMKNSITNVCVSGVDLINKCIIIDQKPIGRSRSSCPATYTGIFDRVRTLFSKTPEALEQSYKAGLFSLNSEGGCRVCKGDGAVHYHVGFGNFIDLECEACGGTGFVEEATKVTLDGKNIRDILEMSVTQAIEYFKDKDKTILRILRTLERVGMGYIKLGQKTPTISGGEAQRIKLAKELSKNNTSKSSNLYFLDEPTTGLSFSDIEQLIELMQKLTDTGNTIIVTEHDPYVLSNCDYIFEMGPGGGSDGGYIIAKGSPTELKANKSSIIGKYLR